MLVTCPKPGDEIPLWDVCGAETVHVLITEDPAAIASARGTDGRMPHLRYRVANAGVQYKEITGLAGTFRNGQNVPADTDVVFSVEFDAGIHHLPWAGGIYLVGGNPAVNVQIACFRAAPTVRVDSFQWPSDQKTAQRRTLTTLVLAGATTTIPNWHDRIGAYVTRAGVTVQGVAATLGPTEIPAIPGSTVSNPAGADLMVFTSVTF